MSSSSATFLGVTDLTELLEIGFVQDPEWSGLGSGQKVPVTVPRMVRYRPTKERKERTLMYTFDFSQPLSGIVSQVCRELQCPPPEGLDPTGYSLYYGFFDDKSHQWLFDQDLMDPHALPTELRFQLLPPFEAHLLIPSLQRALSDLQASNAKFVIFETQLLLAESSWFAREFVARGGVALLLQYARLSSGKNQAYALAAIANITAHGIALDQFPLAELQPCFAELALPWNAARPPALKASVQILAALAEEGPAQLGVEIDGEISRRNLLPQLIAMFDIEEIGVQCAALSLINALIRLRAFEDADGSRERRLALIQSLIRLGIIGKINALTLSSNQELATLLTHFQILLFSTRIPRPYNPSLPEHEEKVLRLWSLSFPDQPLPSRISTIWNHLGFQSDDPARDFRAMGIEGLDHLLYFATHKPKLYSTILLRLKKLLITEIQPGVQGQLLSNSRWYPFAIAGINISQLLYTVWKIPGQASQYKDPRPAAPINKLDMVLSPLLLSEPSAFEEIYILTFELFDTLWTAMNATYMGFNRVIEAVRVRLFAFIGSVDAVSQFATLVHTAIELEESPVSSSSASADNAGNSGGLASKSTSQLPCRSAHSWVIAKGSLRHNCYICQTKSRKETQYCQVCARHCHTKCWDAQKHTVSAAASTRPVDHQIVPHKFLGFTACIVCNKSISVLQKAARCIVCRMPVHLTCKDRVRNDCNTLLYSSDPGERRANIQASASTISQSFLMDDDDASVVTPLPPTASSGTSIFGLSLTDSIPDGKSLPKFLETLLSEFLQEPGALETINIFIVDVPKAILDDAYKVLQSGLGYNWRDTPRPPHTAANLIKLYLRSLPDPPFTSVLAPDFCDAVLVNTKALSIVERLQPFTPVWRRLPPQNRRFLIAFGKFLSAVVEHKDSNRMDCPKLSGIFSPLLLGTSSPTGVIGSYAAAQTIEFLINNNGLLDG